MSYALGGTTNLTASANVNSSNPTRVFAIHFASGGTAGVVNLRNGTTSSGTVYVKETGSISTGKTVVFGTGGIVFPGGLYVDMDGNTTLVTVTYSGA